MDTANGDTFTDILEERRKTSDISYALKTWNVAPCRYSLKRTPQEIQKYVLASEKIKNVIIETSKENGKTEEEIAERAKAIVEEMSHNFQFRVIRFFAYTLSKFMKSVYGKILVNKKGVEKIGTISTQYPVLYLPTHRSYSDFLLVSYVCYYFNLPVPVIAAGLDFLGLNFLTFLLRGAGAFFIRRSFVGDHLYKEIFAEYVQTHIEGCENPMEFFIEGTRSRSAKSLIPKLGMLQVILEMFFSSKVPDIIVVPISISYDRTLEETLYAYELLGVPKPKESARSLFKARKVMSDFYGNVYVRFGEQISLKEYFRTYNRSVHNLQPRALSTVLKEEQLLCRDLANHVIRMHQCNLVLSPFPLMCLVVSQPITIKNGGVHFNVLVDYVYWLEELIRRNGATIYADNHNLSKSLNQQIELHSNIIQMSDEFFVSFKNVLIQHPTSPSNIPRLHNDTVTSAIPSMFAYHYGNQALQLLVHICMISLSVVCSGSNSCLQSDLFYRYKVLRRLLQKEFVFERDTEEKDFLHALQSLKEENFLSVKGQSLIVPPSAIDKLEFLGFQILPFIECYASVCQYLMNIDNENLPDCKKLSLECQGFIETAILNRSVSDYRCLSLDIISNCLASLVSQGAISLSSRSNSTPILPSHPCIPEVMQELELFLPSTSHYRQSIRVPVPSAKL